MTCSTCGALVAIQDASCDACGAEIRTLSPAPVPATPPNPVSEAPAPEIAVRRKPRSRSTTILAIVVAIGILATILASVSRAQVADQLAASEASLGETRGELDASISRASELDERIDGLEERASDLQTELDDTRDSLTACQDVFVIAADAASKGLRPRDVGPDFVPKLMSCFEGELPRSLF